MDAGGASNEAEPGSQTNEVRRDIIKATHDGLATYNPPGPLRGNHDRHRQQ